MALIDKTYFINEIELPTDLLSAKILSMIDIYEPEILTKILGYDMYEEFKTALAGTPDTKWTNLRDGDDFEVNGITYHWRGFTNTLKQSIIAYYVYVNLISQPEVFQSILSVPNTENSSKADSRYKQASIYNKMVDWINEMDYFIMANLSDYPNYNPQTIRKVNIFNI